MPVQPFAAVAFKLKLKAPAAVGVPVSAPMKLSRLKPGGSVPDCVKL